MFMRAGYPLSDEQRRRVEEIFAAASELPNADRAAYLERACGSELGIRDEVESLLGQLTAGTLDALRTARMGPGGGEFEQPDDQIGRFRLIRPLGEGGFGSVWLAAQTEPVRREVALKIIKPGMDSRQILARFDRERQTLALLDHPYVANLLDGGATPLGRPYFVMEYVDGRPITQFCDEERLSVPARLRLFLRVCRAIEHAHQKGVIHRDIKPSNILAGHQNGVAAPRVIDFGIARVLEQPADATALTQESQLIGTPAYMSPEQAAGSRAVDTRSDVYALGALLYELLAGGPPFRCAGATPGSLEQLRRMIIESAARPPSACVADGAESAMRRRVDAPGLRKLLRGDLDWIALKALEKDPARRYQSVADLAQDVTRHLNHEPVQARPPSAAYRARKFVVRNKLLVASVSAIVLALGAGVVGISLALARALTAEADARAAGQTAEREAAIAKAVNDFLNNDLLAAADPGRTANREITVREVIDAAAGRIDERFADQPQVEVAIRGTLATAYRRLGDPAAAEPHQRRAVEICTQTLGESADGTMAARNSLATTLLSLGRFAEAAARLEEDRRILLATRGPDEDVLLRSTSNLAAAYMELGRFHDAAPLLQEALAAKRRTLGDRHPSTLTSIHNLGGLYLNINDLEPALAAYQEAYDGRLAVLGEGDPATLASMNGLGWVLCVQERFEEGQALLEQSIAIGSARLPPGHRSLLRAQSLLGQSYLNGGDARRAEPVFRAVLATTRETAGATHKETLHAMHYLALALLEIEGYEESMQLCNDILPMDVTDLPQDHWLRGEAEIAVGRALAGMGRFEEAQAPLLRGQQLLDRTFGAENERVLTALERVAQFYEDWERADPGRGHAGAGRQWRDEAEQRRRATQHAEPS